jgi:hypothetical protein
MSTNEAYKCSSSCIDKIYVIKKNKNYCIGLTDNWCTVIFRTPNNSVDTIDSSDLNYISLRYLSNTELDLLDRIK